MSLKNLLLIMIFFSLILTGCNHQEVTEVTAPPDSISLDEVTKIDLKELDINKLSKTDIKELDGIKFNQDTVGYQMEYRYPDTPIIIKIVKFNSQSEIEGFWDKWLNAYGLGEYSAQQVVEFNRDNKYSVYAWQKGQWLTYIGVPYEPLKEKVRTVISNHYLKLSKKDQ